jgi:hypothetical protein
VVAATVAVLLAGAGCGDGGPQPDDADVSRDVDQSGDTDGARDADAPADADSSGADGDADAAAQPARVILVVIDGARYSETLGDPERRLVPELSALAGRGCAAGPILNTGSTMTISGTSVIHTGAWDAWREDPVTGEVSQVVPTHWEYTRKQLGARATEVYYVLRYFSVADLWKPSRHEEYGPDYWPTFASEGTSDEEVFDSFSRVLAAASPRFLVLYLADVDAAGHSGSWERYTAAIATADSIVGRVWDLVQARPELASSTTLIVTSDHGRHDDLHGGFSSHGDGCDGCRQVTFVAVGPDVDPGCAPADPPRTLADITPTIGRVLGYEATYGEGEIMGEVFLR